MSVTQCWVMLAVFRRNHRWRRGRLLRYYQAVFLSPRTVDMHVHNILTKLDCRSRTEATDRVVELGLLERRPWSLVSARTAAKHLGHFSTNKASSQS